MRFGIRSLLVITFVAGLLLQVAECVRDESSDKLVQLLLVFFLGSITTVFLSVLGFGIVGKPGAFAGASLGAFCWAFVLWWSHVYARELFQFIWGQAILLFIVMSSTIWAVLQTEKFDVIEKCSVDRLMKVKRAKNGDTSTDT